VLDRMSALGIAAEEIGREPSVKSDVHDPTRTLRIGQSDIRDGEFPFPQQTCKKPKAVSGA